MGADPEELGLEHPGENMSDHPGVWGRRHREYKGTEESYGEARLIAELRATIKMGVH